MNDIIVNGMAFSLPLFIIAVGGIYSERSGVTNLALEGFQGAGAFFGALFVTLTSGMFAATSQLPMYLALVVAMAGGALYAVIHGPVLGQVCAHRVGPLDHPAPGLHPGDRRLFHQRLSL